MHVSDALPEKLSEALARLPLDAGVYLFKDIHEKVIYVGKAKCLRSRVRSYFRGSDTRYQIPTLLKHVSDVEVLVTATVKDALLLENELIKKHRPRFNLRLRDDKQYLALRIDLREEWPHLTMVRKFRDDGAEYFGPYTSSNEMRAALADLQRIFPLRPCTDAVFRDYARRKRPCIKYEMKRCSAPCCNLVSRERYAEDVQGSVRFLRGDSDALIVQLKSEMQAAADSEQFEEAARLRNRIAAIDAMLQRQQIILDEACDRDVFGLAREGGEVQVQALFVREGRLVGASDYAFSDVELDDGALMSSFLDQYYASDAERILPQEVFTPVDLDDDGALQDWLSERAAQKVKVRSPKRGVDREAVAMAERNAALRLANRIETQISVDRALEELCARLSLSKLPRHIECYDVSNLQGSFSVASRVVFRNGQPSKGDYRKYQIRDAEGGDDIACLREVLQRRLARIASEPLPDLWLIDGGKGQLGVALAVLRDARIELDAIGLAKERDDEGSASGARRTPSTQQKPARVKRSGGLKAERIFIPGRKDPVQLPSSSRGLLLLQRIRDESHRFAIEYQRALRQRMGMTSILEILPGIGPKKRRALLRELGSLRAVREASFEQLCAVKGISEKDAQLLKKFFAPASASEASPTDTALEATLCTPEQICVSEKSNEDLPNESES